jgi:hypothetical protein
VSEKHGGATTAENLANACAFCNRAKGSDIGSIVEGGGEYTRLFNPRSDQWDDHFSLQASRIVPRTTIGQVTAKLLGFNLPERLLEREALIRVGRYPPPDIQNDSAKPNQIS